MTEVEVRQIGLGSFGWHGFRKLVDIQKHSDRVDLELKGVYDLDPERLERAGRYAESSGVEIELFSSLDDLYSSGAGTGQVMVYDASPSPHHAEHLQRSVENGFLHLAEKPPSMTREQHRHERALEDAMWKCDFIERESPVVEKAVEEVETLESAKVFRQSPRGIRKLSGPEPRPGIKGGDTLDKMVHEVYLLDLLEAAGKEWEPELEEVSASFMPYAEVSDSIMGTSGEKLSEVKENAATGMTSASFRTDGVEVELHSSWLGVSEQAVRLASGFDTELVDPLYVEGGNSYMSHECRFFLLEGERKLLGDLLHGRLHDLSSGGELELPEKRHDQLYRMLEKAAADASSGGFENDTGDLDFMELIFDVRERAISEAGTVHEELEKVRKRLRQMRMSDVPAAELELELRP